MANARISFTPRIYITAEHAADVLCISIEKANQVISRPDTKEILQKAIEIAVQTALLNTLQEMVRIPHETVPMRRDVVVKLPPLPTTCGESAI